MGMKEDALALADELGAFEDGDCEECGLYGQPECKGHLSCMEIMARYAARKMREAVERDGEGATTVSAYDLLLDEDRKAIAWVFEHGGLEAVKASIHQGAMEHGYLLKVAEILGTSIYDGTGNADALLDKLRKRLMPEDMEWPKHTDGELVRIGGCWGEDGCDTSITYIERIIFAEDGVYLDNEYNEAFYRHGERVKRPAPKVLDSEGVECNVGDAVWWVHNKTGNFRIIRIEQDGKCAIHDDDADEPCGMTVPSTELTHKRPVIDADGVEIREGDVLYRKSDGRMVKVAEVYEKTFIDAEGYVRPGDGFTHRAPVLAADGKPIREGETVWHVGNGVEFTVIGLPNPGEYQSVKLRLDGGASTGLDPDLLTHQRPVLDADGNRIEPAMDVWWICEGDERGAHAEKLHVESIGEDGLVTCDPFNGGTWVELEPSELYVNRPVLDADGAPIKKGDTVWNATTSARPLTVREIERSDDPDEPEDIVWCGERAANGFKVWRIADQLTHAKPEIDAWERIEEDAKLAPGDYIEKHGRKTDLYAYQEMPIDLVRRCRALAERGA